MLLRFRTAVVVAGAPGLGHEVCLRLARAGAGVLVADPDLGAAEATAALVRERRVPGWALQADLADDVDLQMLGGRARDLGGADLVVAVGADPERAETLARALLTEPVVLDVPAGPDPGRTAAAVLARLTTAPDRAAVRVHPDR